ncbi:hypothetical protein Trydic_g5757 [Trypoxylus dichotomus]
MLARKFLVKVKYTSTVSGAKIIPAGFKELSHTVTSFPYRTIIFVKSFAVIEDLPNIRTKLFPGFITAIEVMTNLKSCQLRMIESGAT